jgi:hypothetical protein
MSLSTALFNFCGFFVLLWAFEKLWWKATHCKWASDKGRPGHLPPQDKSYKGGFTNLVECRMCNTRSLVEDRGIDTCSCGSLKRRHFVGYWISDNKRGGQWYERN